MTVKFSLGINPRTLPDGTIESLPYVKVVFSEEDGDIIVKDFGEIPLHYFGGHSEFTEAYIRFRKKVFGNRFSILYKDVYKRLQEFESRFNDEQKLLLECIE